MRKLKKETYLGEEVERQMCQNLHVKHVKQWTVQEFQGDQYILLHWFSVRNNRMPVLNNVAAKSLSPA